MKGSRSTANKQSKQGYSHKPRPEIRDDIDSRKRREQDKETEETDPENKSPFIDRSKKNKSQ